MRPHPIYPGPALVPGPRVGPGPRPGPAGTRAGLPLGINLGCLGQPSGGPVHTMEPSRLHFGMQNNGLDTTLTKRSKNTEIKVSTFFLLLAHLLPSPLFCIQKCSRLAPNVRTVPPEGCPKEPNWGPRTPGPGPNWPGSRPGSHPGPKDKVGSESKTGPPINTYVYIYIYINNY